MDILKSIRRLDPVYNDPDFIVFMESHLQHFKTQGNVTQMSVTEQQNLKYEGDFYGLLGELKCLPEHRYIVMRVNGLDVSSDYRGDFSAVIIPDIEKFTVLKQVYKSKKKF